MEDHVTAVHAIHTTQAERSHGLQLLCSAFAFASPERPLPVLLVCPYKRATFYPFAATNNTRRDTETELSIRAAVGAELPVEAELERCSLRGTAPRPAVLDHARCDHRADRSRPPNGALWAAGAPALPRAPDGPLKGSE